MEVKKCRALPRWRASLSFSFISLSLDTHTIHTSLSIQSTMSSSSNDHQTVLEEADENTLRILISTDNHLGYNEKDPVRGMDSFAAFEEVLYLARRFQCDMVLLAGDLFHDNRPSRQTMYKAMEILRRYCLGDHPVQIQLLSDPRVNFASAVANYQDPHFAVDLPLFSIHGNHDDPVREGTGQAPLAALGECVRLWLDGPIPTCYQTSQTN